MQDIPWELAAIIGASLTGTLGYVWKRVLDLNKDKDDLNKEMRAMQHSFFTERLNDNEKNVLMLLKATEAHDKIMNLTPRFEGMITRVEKEQLISKANELHRAVMDVAEATRRKS